MGLSKQARALASSLLLSSAFVATAQQPAIESKLQQTLGPNVYVFTPQTDRATAQGIIDRVYAEQQHAEFGTGRCAFVFLPGQYKLDIPVGFYTQVLGLGGSPDAVRINGSVRSDAALDNNNATTTFWRGVEGFSVQPAGGTMQWAVSQAVEFRRMHVLGDVVLHQHGGWASGGWMSDTAVDGNVDSGSQQQWISRNVGWKSWTGSNWNMVFVGVDHAPPGQWPKPRYTVVDRTSIVREKPFLTLDGSGRIGVNVPALTKNTIGVTWQRGRTPGRFVPLENFYIARPEADTATTINAALAQGKNILFTPGTFELDSPLTVTHKDAVLLGLGFATLHPTNGTAAMTVADVDGVTVSGLLFDAGERKSPVLLQVGAVGSHLRHVDDPISLHDVFFRVGGAGPGKIDANLVINSNDVIVDHTWIWRADHGKDVGWDKNESANGLIVNGDDVTIYGLFVEHHQQFQVLWNGERGRTYFYQSEIPYDPPTQAAWKSAQVQDGWASYKVSDNVRDHEAWGLGIYSVFRHPDVKLTHAIEAPDRPSVRFHHMITVALDNLGEIEHAINNTGAPATTAQPRIDPTVDEYPAKQRP